MCLLTFCDLDSFSWLLLWWLLPFLLGILLGYLIWWPWKQKFDDSRKELGEREVKIIALEKELRECQAEQSQVSDEVIFLRAQIRELRGSLDQKQSKEQRSVGQGELSASKTTASIYSALDQGNLQIVEGIGPKMEAILKEKGIRSWAELGEKSVGDIQALLDSYGNKYRIIDPSTWPTQAGMAARGDWDALIAFQKEMSGSSVDDADRQSKVEKILVKLGVLRQWEKDDLEAIEGIGPKTDVLLRSKGIDSWERLSSTSVEQLQGILDDAGDQFRLSDPMTWPDQAKLAAQGRWKELEQLQDLLIGGKKA